MEIALGLVAASVLIWVFVSNKRDKEFIQTMKERNAIEDKKLFVEQAKHRQMVKRWEEHKSMKSIGDFKKKSLADIGQGAKALIPTGIKPLVPSANQAAFEELLRKGIHQVGTEQIKRTVPPSTANH